MTNLRLTYWKSMLFGTGFEERQKVALAKRIEIVELLPVVLHICFLFALFCLCMVFGSFGLVKLHGVGLFGDMASTCT